VASAGFGVPLVISHSKTFAQFGGSDRVVFVESAAEVLTAGFTATDPEYLAIEKMFSQSPAPNKVAIGLRTACPVQKHKVELVAAAVEGKEYAFIVNSQDGSSSANLITATAPATPDAEDVVDLWITMMGTKFPALTCTKVGTGAAAVLEITGAFRSIQPEPVLVKVSQTHAVVSSPTIAADLALFAEASDEWYGVLSLVPSKAEALAVAAWVEANGKLFVVQSQDFEVITSGTGDLATAVKAASYARTVVIFERYNGNFADAAWMGQCLSFDPGSATWKFKTLAGVSVLFKLSTSEVSYAQGKNCNVYLSLGGRSITAEGVVGVGEFVDVIHFRDWLVARIGERVFGRLATAKKVPFTDGGIAIIEADVKAQLSEGVTVGGLAADPAPTTTAPKVASVNPVDKAARLLRTINFTGTLAGAVHKLTIRGTVSA
jgi:hypothetical protein